MTLYMELYDEHLTEEYIEAQRERADIARKAQREDELLDWLIDSGKINDPDFL